ncbi:hypothetical protein SMID22_17100 [Streptococcus mitis]|uniref:hypothetical protein n=1 Tax=Streptococcus mitis TaxID=28037 RepID=UPI00398BEA79
MVKNKSGMITRTKQKFDEYVLIRKYRMKQERDYFASEGESDPKRLEAQKERDKEFFNGLKKIGLGFIVFLVFYGILRTILGLW